MRFYTIGGYKCRIKIYGETDYNLELTLACFWNKINEEGKLMVSGTDRYSGQDGYVVSYDPTSGHVGIIEKLSHEEYLRKYEVNWEYLNKPEEITTENNGVVGKGV